MKPLISLLYGLALLLAPWIAPSRLPLTPVTEAWRIGYQVRQPAFAALEGRLAEAAVRLQTARDPVDSYYAFPVVSTDRRVKDAAFYLLDRSGAYGGEVQLTLAVYDQAGALKRVVSRSTVDLHAAAIGQWTAVDLSESADDRRILSGEILAFHFSLTGGQTGDLVVQPVFEVNVESIPPMLYFIPIIGR